jgi:cytochrome b involved in lipid metabolism
MRTQHEREFLRIARSDCSSANMAGTSGKTFSLEECKQHTSDKDCWLVVHGKVYNVTDFLEEHPGGYDIILTSAGRTTAGSVTT